MPIDPVNHEDNAEDETLFGKISLGSHHDSIPPVCMFLLPLRDNSEVNAYANNLYVA